MINKDKQYRTRDGREVRIYATDGTEDQPVHGAIFNGIRWVSQTWCESGRWQPSSLNCRDLIEVKPRHERVVWLNVYLHGGSIAYLSRNLADANRMNGCIACIKVNLDFEEGEGL